MPDSNPVTTWGSLFAPEPMITAMAAGNAVLLTSLPQGSPYHTIAAVLAAVLTALMAFLAAKRKFDPSPMQQAQIENQKATIADQRAVNVQTTAALAAAADCIKKNHPRETPSALPAVPVP